MYYNELKPPRILQPFVKCIWILENNQSIRQNNDERVIPDGCPELIIHYGDQCQIYNFEQDKYLLQSRIVFAGQIKSSIILRPSASSKMIGVRFTPWGASQFIRASMGTITNRIEPLDSICKYAKHLEEKIMSAESSESRYEILEDFLIEKLLDQRPDIILAKMVEKITSDHGKLSFRDLYQQLDLSERQAERKFLAGVGIGPKQFSKITRVQHSLEKMNEKAANLTDIAIASGYFDQSHFIRDFKSIVGLTPKKYLSENHLISDYFTSN